MLNTTVASASFNLTSIEKKLAAIETLNSTSFVPKPPTRLTKVNNESELDAHLKSERTLFNDQQFDYLTQQVWKNNRLRRSLVSNETSPL